MLWGYGPAVDILQEISEVKSLKHKEELNILIIGGSDGRHILQTIAKYYKHPKKRVNFYVADVMVDMIARQVLLLLTALEPPEHLGLMEKTRLWMELYGNTLMRPTSRKYLVRKARQLIHMVTDEAFLKSRLPLVSLGMLKYKERDNLETIFQFWVRERFEGVVKLWDGRLRHSLGTRYDSRDGVFDWDYYMRLKEVPEGCRINAREYKHWRSCGVAFTWLESEATEPNPTLASGIVKLGDRLVNHGYLGDIVSPPYLGFGTNSEDLAMLETRNGVNLYRSTDIVEANLRRMFYEIEQQTEYHETIRDERELGTVITELQEVHEVPEMEEHEQVEGVSGNEREQYSALAVADTRVVFLPTTALTDLPRKPAFSRLFDVIMVSQNLTQRLSDDVVGLASDGAVLLAETRKFLTTASTKEKEEFVNHLLELGKSRGCHPISPPHPLNDYLVRFKIGH